MNDRRLLLACWIAALWTRHFGQTFKEISERRARSVSSRDTKSSCLLVFVICDQCRYIKKNVSQVASLSKPGAKVCSPRQQLLLLSMVNLHPTPDVLLLVECSLAWIIFLLLRCCFLVLFVQRRISMSFLIQLLSRRP